MTTSEAAALMGVSPRYIRTLIETGRLRVTGGSGRHHLVRSEVLRMVEARRCRRPRSR
jgi:excisionase family DNA binding protein